MKPRDIAPLWYILSSSWLLVHLTQWGRDKMAAVSQTMFSNAFSWMKMYEFRLNFSEVCS